jgi:hypothetical protein
MATRTKIINWQTIETAPIDGTVILLWIEDWSPKIVAGYRRRWSGQEWRKIDETTKKLVDAPEMSEWCHKGTRMPISIFHPTHWAPYIDMSP